MDPLLSSQQSAHWTRRKLQVIPTTPTQLYPHTTTLDCQMKGFKNEQKGGPGKLKTFDFVAPHT